MAGLFSADWGRVALQLLKEFSGPFLISGAWVAIASRGKTATPADLVALFAPAFFFVSWLSGQLFRVSKQVRTESSLGRISSRLDDVVDRLEDSAREVADWATGGKTFAYLDPIVSDDGEFNPARLMLITQGQHPLFKLQARIVDIDVFATLPRFTMESIRLAEHIINLGEVDGGMAYMDVGQLSVLPDVAGTTRRFNIFFTARNGLWSQLLRFRHDGNKWWVAMRVHRANDDGTTEILHENIPADMPDPETLDWG